MHEHLEMTLTELCRKFIGSMLKTRCARCEEVCTVHVKDMNRVMYGFVCPHCRQINAADDMFTNLISQGKA